MASIEWLPGVLRIAKCVMGGYGGLPESGSFMKSKPGLPLSKKKGTSSLPRTVQAHMDMRQADRRGIICRRGAKRRPT